MPVQNPGLDDLMRLLSQPPPGPPLTPLYDRPQGSMNEWDMPWRPLTQNNGAFGYSGRVIPGLSGNYPMGWSDPNYMTGRALDVVPAPRQNI